MWIWFEAECLPAYVWSFPLPNGRANVGLGLIRGHSTLINNIGSLWQEIVERDHFRAVMGEDAEPESSHRTWPIPTRINKVTLTSKRTMFVGDAAAASDPMTGEGISQAMFTGIGAANAVLRNDDEAHRVMANYKKFVRRELFADHRMAQFVGNALTTPLAARAAVRLADLNGWTRRSFARWLFEDYPRSILTTPRRWFRKPLSTPGAYR